MVTNPTQFAVALKYEQSTMRAPQVVAKGDDFMAQRIRELAIEAGVPIVERTPLAGRSIEWSMSARKFPKSFTPPSRRFWRMSTN